MSLLPSIFSRIGCLRFAENKQLLLSRTEFFTSFLWVSCCTCTIYSKRDLSLDFLPSVEPSIIVFSGCVTVHVQQFSFFEIRLIKPFLILESFLLVVASVITSILDTFQPIRLSSFSGSNIFSNLIFPAVIMV